MPQALSIILTWKIYVWIDYLFHILNEITMNKTIYLTISSGRDINFLKICVWLKYVFTILNEMDVVCVLTPNTYEICSQNIIIFERDI